MISFNFGNIPSTSGYMHRQIHTHIYIYITNNFHCIYAIHARIRDLHTLYKQFLSLQRHPNIAAVGIWNYLLYCFYIFFFHSFRFTESFIPVHNTEKEQHKRLEQVLPLLSWVLLKYQQQALWDRSVCPDPALVSCYSWQSPGLCGYLNHSSCFSYSSLVWAIADENKGKEL